MKVYNCFQFFNELDLAEIRIQENWDTTDYFVIAESNYTHSGMPKPYYLLENWERFKPYESKIRRIQVDESIEEQRKQFPGDTDEWVREKYQRWALQKGLHDLQPEDLVVLSDCDEVPRGEMIQMIKEDENNYDRYILKVVHFHFRFNYMRVVPQSAYGNVLAIRGRVFTDPMKERQYTFPWFTRPPETVEVDHGGWQWSDFGNDEHVIKKLKSFCHLDQDNEEILKNIKIDWLIENRYDRDNSFVPKFEIVKVDDYFPKCVTDNLDKWQHMIVPDATLTVEEAYKE